MYSAGDDDDDDDDDDPAMLRYCVHGFNRQPQPTDAVFDDTWRLFEGGGVCSGVEGGALRFG